MGREPAADCRNFNCPTRIRTWTNRTKICCATVTLSGTVLAKYQVGVCGRYSIACRRELARFNISLRPTNADFAEHGRSSPEIGSQNSRWCDGEAILSVAMADGCSYYPTLMCRGLLNIMRSFPVNVWNLGRCSAFWLGSQAEACTQPKSLALIEQCVSNARDCVGFRAR